MSLNRTVPLAGVLCAVFSLLILAFGAKGAAAEGSPFKIAFDASDIQVNAIEDLPLDALTTKATIEGTIDENGNVNIPEGGFVMPELGVTEPVAIKGFMGIEAPATGKFDAATGRLDLDTEAGLWISVDVQQMLAAAGGLGLDVGDLGGLTPYLGLIGENLTCGFSPMDIHFSTEPNSLAGGRRFTSGIGGTGAISAEWSALGPFAGKTKVLGLIDACKLLQTQLPGLLEGLGGSEGGDFDIGALLGEIDLENLDDLDLGPSAVTLIRTSIGPPTPGDPIESSDPAPGDPAPAVAKLKLSVTPKNRRAKRGAKVRYRATVKNVGGQTAGRVRVCIEAPKKAAKAGRCQNLGALAPRASKTRKFNLRLKRSAAMRGYRIGFETRSGTGKALKSNTRLRVIRRR